MPDIVSDVRYKFNMNNLPAGVECALRMEESLYKIIYRHYKSLFSGTTELRRMQKYFAILANTITNFSLRVQLDLFA